MACLFSAPAPFTTYKHTVAFQSRHEVMVEACIEVSEWVGLLRCSKFAVQMKLCFIFEKNWLTAGELDL